MKNPFFSVIIPVYNRKKFLRKAIQSITDQSFQDWELIIVDDCSSDGSWELMQEFANDQIRVFQNEANAERCVTRNNGIVFSRGKYICFLDSDDYHLPNHLETIYKEIQEKNFPKALFFTNAWDENEGVKTERFCPDFEKYNSFQYILGYTFNPQRWAVHRDIFKEIKFDPEVIICEDMDTSARIATKYPVYQIKERTTVYVHHPESFTHGDPQKPFKELFYLKRIFTKAILKGKIPLQSRWRLFSMCYYHIAIKQADRNEIGKMYESIVKSFFLFPPGYNGKTNKVLTVLFLYNLPLAGFVIKKLVIKIKA
jgi:glycosyltransferase involved in cell wall biosynthesis